MTLRFLDLYITVLVWSWSQMYEQVQVRTVLWKLLRQWKFLMLTLPQLYCFHYSLQSNCQNSKAALFSPCESNESNQRVLPAPHTELCFGFPFNAIHFIYLKTGIWFISKKSLKHHVPIPKQSFFTVCILDLFPFQHGILFKDKCNKLSASMHLEVRILAWLEFFSLHVIQSSWSSLCCQLLCQVRLRPLSLPS